jgi:serine-type D-Ala-D-Ala carboxypeptidase (penicillin-binding protein 5/6)
MAYLKKDFLILFITALIVSVLFVIAVFTILPTVISIDEMPATVIASNILKPKAKLVAPNIYAKSAYILDAKTGKVLYEKNAEVQLPLASITKIMMALTALRDNSKDNIVAIKPEFLMTDGDSGLFVGEEWALGDILSFTLLVSSNDGAKAISSLTDSSETHIFVQNMNALAKEVGLTQTYFVNVTGLDNSYALSGGYGSARDVAYMFNYALKEIPNVLEATRHDTLTFTSLGGMQHTGQNTNKITSSLPNLIASKTGYTELAGGNLVVAIDAGPSRPIIISVLGSTLEGRFADVEQLAWFALDSIQSNN